MSVGTAKKSMTTVEPRWSSRNVRHRLLRWRPPARHQSGDRPLRDPESQLQQLSVMRGALSFAKTRSVPSLCVETFHRNVALFLALGLHQSAANGGHTAAQSEGRKPVDSTTDKARSGNGQQIAARGG